MYQPVAEYGTTPLLQFDRYVAVFRVFVCYLPRISKIATRSICGCHRSELYFPTPPLLTTSAPPAAADQVSETKYTSLQEIPFEYTKI